MEYDQGLPQKFRLMLALVYFQANVVWASAPELPIGPSLVSALSSFSSAIAHVLGRPRSPQLKDPVFVFHAGVPPENRPIPDPRPGAGIDDFVNFEERPPAEGRDLGQGGPARDANDVRGHIGTFIRERLAPAQPNLAELKVSDLNLNVLPVDAGARAQLQRLGAAANPNVLIFANADGTVRLDIQEFGSVTLRQIANGVVIASAAPIRRESAVGAARQDALRDLGYAGRTGAGQIFELKGDGKWIVTTDVSTGARSRRFDGEVSWLTATGVRYTARGTADGRVELTRVAEGVVNGRNVSQGGHVVDVEYGRDGKAIASTQFKVGDSETRIDGQLTHFNAAGGAILRQVAAPAPVAAARGAREAVEAPKALRGSVGDYVIREGNLDSVFRMKGDHVELKHIRDARTGDVVVDRNRHGVFQGTLGGVERRFTVDGGPRFDSRTGAAMLSVELVRRAGETDTLSSRPPQAGPPGIASSPGPARAGPTYDGVTFQAKANGKFEARAVQNGARMAATMSLGSGHTELAQTNNIRNATFLDGAGNLAGRTLDGVRVLGADGAPMADRPPLVAFTTDDVNVRRAYGRIGVVQTAPFSIVRNATEITGSLQVGAGNRPQGSINFTLAEGRSATLKIQNGRHDLAIDNSRGQGLVLDLGAAAIAVDAGAKGTINLDDIFSGKPPAFPAGMTVTETAVVEKKNVTHLHQIGMALDARVTGGGVQAWLNPLTGNFQFSQNGLIQVRGQGFGGTVKLENGRGMELNVASDAGGASTLTFAAGHGRANSLFLPAGRAVAIDLVGGGFKATADKLPGMLDGVRLRTAEGIDISFAADAAAPGGLAAVLNGDFQAYGTHVAQDEVAAVRIYNGRVTLDFVAPVVTRRDVTVAPDRADGVARNVEMIRLDVTAIGTTTGVGHTTMAENSRLFSPRGGAGGAGPNMSGLATRNVLRENGPEGETITAIAGKGPSQVGITFQEIGGRVSGTLITQTGVMENVQVNGSGDGVAVNGFQLIGRWTVNQTAPGDFTFRPAEKNAIAQQTDGVAYIVPRAGMALEFQRGSLTNLTQLPGLEVVAGGTRVRMVPGAEINALNRRFESLPADQRPERVDEKNAVPVLLAGNKLEVFGIDETKLKRGPLVVTDAKGVELGVRGHVEGGRILFWLKAPEKIAGSPAFALQNPAAGPVPEKFARDPVIERIGFETANGRGVGGGAFILTETISTAAEDPERAAPAAPERAGRRAPPGEGNSAATGTAGVRGADIRDAEGRLTGHRLTPVTGKTARVNATFTAPDKPGDAIRVTPNIVSDHADVTVDAEAGFTATNLGQRVMPGGPGGVLRTREASRLNYTVDFAGVGGELRDITPEGRNRVITTEANSGASPIHRLSFLNGQLVEAVDGPRGEGNVLTAGSDRETKDLVTAGNFSVRLDAPAAPKLPDGVSVVWSSPVTMDIVRGRVTNGAGGLELKNSKDSAAVIDLGGGRSIELDASPSGARRVEFAYLGTEGFAPASAIDVHGGVARLILARQTNDAGAEQISAIEFTPWNAKAVTIAKPKEGAARTFLVELRQTRFMEDGTATTPAKQIPFSNYEADRAVGRSVRREDVRLVNDNVLGMVLHGTNAAAGTNDQIRIDGNDYVLSAPADGRGRIMVSDASLQRRLNVDVSRVLLEDGELASGRLTQRQALDGGGRYSMEHADGSRVTISEANNGKGRVQRAALDIAATSGRAPVGRMGTLSMRVVMTDDDGHPHWGRQDNVAGTFRFEVPGGTWKYDGQEVKQDAMVLAGTRHEAVDTYLTEANINKSVTVFTAGGMFTGTVRDLRGANKYVANRVNLDGLFLEIGRDANNQPIYLVTSNTQSGGTNGRMAGNTFMVGSGSRFSPNHRLYYETDRTAAFLEGSHLFLHDASSDRYEISGKNASGYVPRPQGGGAPGGAGAAAPAEAPRARFRIEGEQYREKTIWVEGRLEITGGSVYVQRGTIAENTAPARGWNDRYQVNGTSEMTPIIEVAVAGCNVNEGFNQAQADQISAGVKAWSEARTLGRDDFDANYDIRRGLRFTVLVNGQNAGEYAVNEANRLYDFNWHIVWHGKDTSDLAGGGLLLTSLPASGRGGFQRPTQYVYAKNGTDEQKLTPRFGQEANFAERPNGLDQTVPTFGDNGAVVRNRNVRVVTFTENEQLPKTFLQKMSPFMGVSGFLVDQRRDTREVVKDAYAVVGDGQNNQRYNMFGFREAQHILGDGRYSEESKDAVRSRLMADVKGLEDFFNTGVLKTHSGQTLQGDAAWRYMQVDSGNQIFSEHHAQLRPRIGLSDIAITFSSQNLVRLAFGDTSMMDALPANYEEKQNRQNAANYATNGRSLMVGETRDGVNTQVDEVANRISANDPYVFGSWALPRWIDTIPDRIMSWAVANPADAVIFTAIFVGLVALQFVPGVGQFVSTWVVGSAGMGAFGTLAMTALAAWNFTSIATHLNDEGLGAFKNGWFIADLVFAALPAVSAGIAWARGGAAVMKAAEGTQFAVKTVHEANEAARAMRMLGWTGKEIRGGGEGLQNALKAFAEGGLKDSSSLAKFAGELRGAAHGGKAEGVGRIFLDSAGKATMREITAGALAGAKTGLAGGAKLTALEFAQALKAAKFATVNEIKEGLLQFAKAGLETTSKEGQALAGQWLGRIMGSMLKEGAGTPGLASVVAPAKDLAAARNVGEAIAGLRGTDPARLVSSILGNKNLSTVAEQIFVLGKVVGSDAALFARLGGELAEKGGATGLKTIFQGGEKAVGTLFSVIQAGEKTAGGLLGSLGESGGKTFVAIVKEGGGERLVTALTKGGDRGADFGRNIGLVLNEGGEGAVKFFSTVSDGGALLFSTRLAADSTGQFTQEFARVLSTGRGAGESLALSFNALAGHTAGAAFVGLLGSSALDPLAALGKDQTKLGALLKGANAEAAGNMAHALNEGGQAAAQYLLKADPLRALTLLNGETTAVRGLFRGLGESTGKGAEMGGARLASVDSGVAQLLNSVRSLGGEGSGSVARSLGQAIGGAREGVFAGLASHLGDAKGLTSLGDQLAKGGSEAGSNFSRFTLLASSESQYGMLRNVLGAFSAETGGRFLSVGLKGEGVGNLLKTFSTFGRASARFQEGGLKALTAFFEKGGEGGALMFGQLKNAEGFAEGLLRLGVSSGDASAIFGKIFASFTRGGAGDVRAASAALADVFNAFGSRLASTVANLGKGGAAEKFSTAVEKAVAGSTKNLEGVFEFAGKSARGRIGKALESAVEKGLPQNTWQVAKDKLAAMSPRARGAFESVLGLTTTDGGKARLLEAALKSNPRAMTALFESAGMSAQGFRTLAAVLDHAVAGGRFVELMSGLGERGAVRLGKILSAMVRAEQGVAFFESLKDVGRFASFLDQASEKAVSRVASILSNLTDPATASFAKILESANVEVLSAFFGRLTDRGVSSFTAVLNALGEKAGEIFPALFKNLNERGAATLSRIFNETSEKVLISFFKNLEVRGAENFGQLLSGLTRKGSDAIVGMFTALNDGGAALFAKILNTVPSAEGLKGFFNALEKGAGAAFAKFLNAVPAGSTLEANVIKLFGALNERGGKALAQIFNKGETAINNLTKALSAMKGDSAKELGLVLNQLSGRGARVLAEAMNTMSATAAGNFGRFMNLVGAGKADVIAKFMNNLSLKNGGEILKQMFEATREIGKIASLFRSLTGNGGEMLGRLLSRFESTGKAIAFLQKVKASEVAGLAGFLNAADAAAIKSALALFEGPQLKAVLDIFRLGGAEAGAGVARALMGAGPKGAKSLGELFLAGLKDAAGLKAMSEMFAGLGRGGAEGARLLGQMVEKMGSAEIEALFKFISMHGGMSEGGEVVARLFKALAMGKADPVAMAQLIRSGAIKGLNAGETAGALIRAGLSRGGSIADNVIAIRTAVRETIGQNSAGLMGRAWQRLTGKGGANHAADVVEGLFFKQSRATGSALENVEKQAFKDIVSTLLGSNGGLSGAQRNALRAMVKSHGAEEFIPIELLKNEGIRRMALNAGRNFFERRVDAVIYLWNNPQKFTRMMYQQGFQWAQFGFSGVGSLVPFGYEGDVFDANGMFVRKGKGWFLGWVDPITGEHIAFSKEGLGKICEHVFLGWDDQHVAWRLRSANQMFREGVRFGPLLHTFGLQPGGMVGRAAQRGVGGNIVYGTARIFNFAGRRVGLGFETAAFDGSLSSFFSRALARVGGAPLAESSFGHIGGMALLGWEAVLPFHIVTSVGHWVGDEMGDAYIAIAYGKDKLSEEERAKIRHSFSEVTGRVAMFMVPQGRFETQMTAEVFKSGREAHHARGGSRASELAGEYQMRDAAHAANEILRSGGSGREAVTIQLGADTFRMEAAQAQQMRGQAARALVLATVELGGAGKGNLFAGELHEALLLSGSAREQALSALVDAIPEIGRLELHAKEVVSALETHLIEASGLSARQIAEGQGDGVLSVRAEVKELSAAREASKNLTAEQIRDALVTDARAEAGRLKPAEARKTLERETAAERLAARDPGALDEIALRSEVREEVGKMSNGEVASRMEDVAGRRAAERAQASPERAKQEWENQRVAEKAKDVKAFAIDGRIVDAPEAGAVRLSPALRAAVIARYNASLLSRLGKERMEELGKAELGGTLRTSRRWNRWGAEEFVVTRDLRARGRQTIETRAALREAGALVRAADAAATALENEVTSHRKEVSALALRLRDGRADDVIKLNGKEFRVEALREMSLKDLVDAGALKLEGRADAIWSFNDGIGSFTLEHFTDFIAETLANPRAYQEAGLMLKTAEQINGVARTMNRGLFRWKPGQLIAAIQAARGNINMAAGAGKTPIMVARALAEALAPGAKESTSVMLISENPSSVDNILGRGGLFDLAEVGKSLGIEVVDLRQELAFARAGSREGKPYSIQDVIDLMKDGTRGEAGAARRIVVVDFDTLGGALSEFKHEGFLRAYTDTTVRLFDEVHRVVTDPVTYVIGGGNGLTASSRGEFSALKALERSTVSREGRAEEAGLSADGRTLRVRGENETILVFRSRAEFERAGDRAAALLEVTGGSPVADLNASALKILQKSASADGAETLTVGHARSFLRGRLTEIHMLEADIKYVNNMLVDGKRDGQYRPLQRGLGLRDSQVIEDIAYLTGMNARRAELHFGGEHHVTYSESSETFQILETIRGISRYEFFETTGEAVQGVKMRGFTATAVGYKDFIRLATGAEVLDISGQTNSLDSSIDGLAKIHMAGARGRAAFYNEVAGRIVEIARDGAELRGADGGARRGTRELDSRVLLGTEDGRLMDHVIAKLEAADLGGTLYAKTFVYDVALGKAVKTPAGVSVRVTTRRVGERNVTTAEIVGKDAHRYEAIRRVINNETDDNRIQAIVASFSEENSTAVANQRGLTGKNFQETGTVVLADPHLTTGEIIQNLERLGRTQENGAYRFDVRREVFLNRGDLIDQVEAAYSRRSVYEGLFQERVNNSLTRKSTLDAMKQLFAQITAEGGTREAIESVVTAWSQPEAGGLSSSRGLLRLNTELNLLGRNSDVAKTVANEVFFHHDLGRALSDASYEAGRSGNARSKGILERFEAEFRNERGRAEEDLRKGNDIVTGKEQLARISDGSRGRSEGLLANFLRGEGAGLTRSVRQILERQLDYLTAARKLSAMDVMKAVDEARASGRPSARGDASFANSGRGVSEDSRTEADHPGSFRQSRELIYERLGNDMAPAVEGGAASPRQIVQAAADMRAAGADAATVESAMRMAGKRGYTYRVGAVEYLNSYGTGLIGNTTRLLSLDNRDRQLLASFLSRVDGGLPDAASPVALLGALADKGLINFKDGADRTVDTLLNLASAFDRLGGGGMELRLGLADLKELLSATLPGYDALRPSLAQAPERRAVLDAARDHAPVTALLGRIMNAAPTEALKAEHGAARRLVDAAQVIVDRFSKPTWISRTPLNLLLRWLQPVCAWFVKHKTPLLTTAGVIGAASLVAAAGALWTGAITFGGITAALAPISAVLMPVLIVLGGAAYGVTRFGRQASLTVALANVRKEGTFSVKRALAAAGGNVGLTVDRISSFRPLTIEHRANLRAALAILAELGDHAVRSRSRMTVNDLLEAVGAETVQGGRWSMKPKLAAAVDVSPADFRARFREKSAAAAKAQFSPRVARALDRVGTVLQFGAAGSFVFGPWTLLFLPASLVLKKMAGKESFLDPILGFAAKLTGKSTPEAKKAAALDEKEKALRGSIWDAPALGRIGSWLGVRGDRALFAALALHGRAEVAAARAKADTSGANPFHLRAVIDRLHDAKVPVRLDDDAALAALGYTVADRATMAERHMSDRLSARPALAHLISSDDLADLNAESFDLRLTSLNFKWIVDEIAKARAGVERRVATSPAALARISSESATPLDRVRAIDAMILTGRGADPRIDDVRAAARGNASIEDFLYQSLGLRPDAVRKNMERLDGLLKMELGPTVFAAFGWILPKAVGAKEMGASYDFNLDGVDGVSRIVVESMRVYRVSNVGAPASLAEQISLRDGFLDAASAYLARSDDQTRGRVARALRDAFGNPDFQQAPWVFFDDAPVIRRELAAVLAAVTVSDLTIAVKGSDRAGSLRDAYRALVNSADVDARTVGEVLRDAGLSAVATVLPASVGWRPMDGVLREVIEALELARADALPPFESPAADDPTDPLSPDEDDAPGSAIPADGSYLDVADAATPAPVERSAGVTSGSQPLPPPTPENLPNAAGAAWVIELVAAQFHERGAPGLIRDARAVFTSDLALADDIGDEDRANLWVVRDDRHEITMIAALNPDVTSAHLIAAATDTSWTFLSRPPVSGAGQTVEAYHLKSMGERQSLHRVVPVGIKSTAPADGRSRLPRFLNALLPRWVTRVMAPIILAAGLTLGLGSTAKAQAPVAPDPATVSVEPPPAAGAEMALRMSRADGSSTRVRFPDSARIFDAADRLVSDGAAEGLHALGATRLPDGQLVLNQGRAVRSVRFDGAPEGGTSGLRELARELARVPATDPLVAIDRAAAANVRRLLSPETGFSGWMSRLQAGALISVALVPGSSAADRFAPQVAALRQSAGERGIESLTLAEVLGFVKNDRAFTDFVYQLVAYHAESVAAPGNVMIAGNAYRRLHAELGIVVLMHSHGGLMAPSLTDQRTLELVRAFEKRNGLRGADGLMVVAMRGPDGKAYLHPFVSDRAGRDVVTRNGIRTMDLPKGVAEPLIHFVDEAEADQRFLALLLPAPARAFLERQGVTLAPEGIAFDLADPQDRARAEAVLSAVETMVDRRMDAGAIRAVWEVAYAVAHGRVSDSRIGELVSAGQASRLDLTRLTVLLSSQMRASSRLMAAGASGHLMVLHRNVESLMPHQFGAVSAMPAEREWIISRMGRISLRLVGPRDAALRAERLRKSIALDRERAAADVVDKLMALTGLGTDRFAENLRRVMPVAGGYVAASDVVPVILGQGSRIVDADQRELVQSAAIALLLEPMARALIRSSRLSLEDEGLRSALEGVTLQVVSRARLGSDVTGRWAGFDPETRVIRLAIDPDLSGPDALIETVGLLAHEVAHLFADPALPAYQAHPFGIPRVVEEAWVQRAAGTMLRELGLFGAADLSDLRTYERIGRMQTSQVVYLVYGADVRRDAEKLKSQVWESEGLNNVVVMAEKGAEVTEATKVFARSGVRVVRMDALSWLSPRPGMTKLETDAELTFGTSRVRLGLPASYFNRMGRGGRDVVVSLLRLLITPEGSSLPALELLMPIQELSTLFERAIEARVIARQA